VPIDKVHRIGIGAPAAAIAQFSADKIDIYVTGSYSGAYQIMSALPDTQMFVDFGDTSTPETLRMFAQGVWIASGQWVKDNPEQVIAYRSAIAEAIAWIVGHPAEAADLMNKVMFEGHDLATAKKSVDVQILDYYKPARPDLACGRSGFEAAAKTFEQQGLGPASQFKFEDLIPSIAIAK
jgi:ABC-type nitrate/sulfonate/bicarbonate transport system substrate-binding protein